MSTTGVGSAQASGLSGGSSYVDGYWGTTYYEGTSTATSAISTRRPPMRRRTSLLLAAINRGITSSKSMDRANFFRLKAGPLLFCLCLALAIVPQAADGVSRQMTERLSQFESADPHVRTVAFYDLLDLIIPGGLQGRTWMIPTGLATFFSKEPTRKDVISLALINLLQRETDVVRRARMGSLTEEYENYRGDLIAAVAGLRDPRGIDVLLANIGTGNIATTAIAAFGRDCLDRVVSQIDSDDPARKIGAIRTLGQMLDPAIVIMQEPASLGKIRAGLLHASKDRQSWARTAAISGLAKLSGADITAVLKGMAERDPYHRKGHPGQPELYPVRDAAKRALESRGKPEL